VDRSTEADAARESIRFTCAHEMERRPLRIPSGDIAGAVLSCPARPNGASKAPEYQRRELRTAGDGGFVETACRVRKLGFMRRGCIRGRAHRGGLGAQRLSLLLGARHEASASDWAVRGSASGAACGCCSGRRSPAAHARGGVGSRSVASRGTRSGRCGRNAPRSRSPSARGSVSG
jgi:hypothetical protein